MSGASGPATSVTQMCRLPKWLGRGAHFGVRGTLVSVVNIPVDKGRKQGGFGAIEGIVKGMFPWRGRRIERGLKGISRLSRNSESQVETPGLCVGPAQGPPTFLQETQVFGR